MPYTTNNPLYCIGDKLESWSVYGRIEGIVSHVDVIPMDPGTQWNYGRINGMKARQRVTISRPDGSWLAEGPSHAFARIDPTVKASASILS